jgi:hypothetical protein
MFWANEPYIVTAADLVPGTHVGRFWRAQTRQWETCTDRNPAEASFSVNNMRLRGIDTRVVNAVGGIKSGVRLLVFLVPDPQHPGIIVPVTQGFQSSGNLVFWHGDIPIGAGVGWRIQQGGVIATDVVAMTVGYE